MSTKQESETLVLPKKLKKPLNTDHGSGTSRNANQWRSPRCVPLKELLVPDGWEVKKIASLCKILDNLRVPLNDEERQNMKGHIPYYGANAIVDYIDDYLFDEDLILLAEDGGNFDDYENRPIAFKISGKTWVNNHAHVIRPNKDKDFNYIFYSLEHKNIIHYIRGGTRSKLNQSDLKDIDLLIPKQIEEQQKIAKILSTLDDAIESTQTLIEKEKNIKKGLMSDLLTNGIDENNTIRTPQTHEYKESELGMIPVGWEVVSLKDIGTCKNGLTYSPKDIVHNGGLLVLRSSNIQNSKLEYNDNVFVRDDIKLNYKVQENDILVCVRNGSKNLIGKNALITKEVKNMAHGAFMTIFHSKINNYVFQLFQSDMFSQQVEKNIGATINSINNSDLILFKFPFPPNEGEQKQIAKILSTQDKKIEKEQQNLAKLKELKNGLMGDLLSGDVRVMV